MKQFLKSYIRSFVFRVSEAIGLDRQLILGGQIRGQQIIDQNKLDCLSDAEFQVFSQWGEDGILSWLVDTVKPETQRFVEFGVEDFRESNCRYLIQTRNWSGLVIDGSKQNIASIKAQNLSWRYDLTAHCEFIDRENIAKLIAENGFGGPLGILSTDIDGVDYWILEAITNQVEIVVVEYNDLFAGRAVSVPYDPGFNRHTAHHTGMYWGASLDAFRYLLEARGYVFVGSNSVGTNAFFVHASKASKVTEKLERVRHWPCKMRDVRREDGSLLLETYSAAWEEIADLPLIEVSTKEKVRVRDVVEAR